MILYFVLPIVHKQSSFVCLFAGNVFFFFFHLQSKLSLYPVFVWVLVFPGMTTSNPKVAPYIIHSSQKDMETSLNITTYDDEDGAW